MNPDEPVVRLKDQKAWERWLEKNNGKLRAVWLEFAKKGVAIKTVNYAEAVESALCYGWIDGQGRSGGPQISLQRFTPRGPRSRWSKINREKALKLIEDGRMKPSGFEAIERAKANGEWDKAYDPPSTATVPDDLQRALNKNVKAKKFFASLDSQNRYAILHRIAAVKKPETRAARIAKFVEMCAKGEKLHP